MKQALITEEQFKAYQKIKESGLVGGSKFNEMAMMIRKTCKVDITTDECFKIYRDYSTYLSRWDINKKESHE